MLQRQHLAHFLSLTQAVTLSALSVTMLWHWGRGGRGTWSWLPTSISVGCVHSRNCSSTEFRATTGSAPRACQKSPGVPAARPESGLCACRESVCRHCRVEQFMDAEAHFCVQCVQQTYNA